MEGPSISINDFENIEQIGEGGSSVVYRATSRMDGTTFAIKQISKSAVEDHQRTHEIVRNELKLAVSLSHQSIVQCFDSFEDEESYFIVMEYLCNGSLLDLVNSKGGLSEDEARNIFLQIMDGVQYLHNHGIVHRDIKLENIMLDQFYRVKIIDFGLSKMINAHNDIMQTLCGSLAYAPPEMLAGKQYTMSADVWSLGTVLYGMVAGVLPFFSESTATMIQKILYEPLDTESLLVSEELKNLLTRMLAKDPAERITDERIEEHEWLAKAVASRRVNAKISRSLDAFPEEFSKTLMHRLMTSRSPVPRKAVPLRILKPNVKRHAQIPVPSKRLQVPEMPILILRRRRSKTCLDLGA